MGRMIVFRNESEHSDVMNMLRKGKELIAEACAMLESNTESDERNYRGMSYRHDTSYGSRDYDGYDERMNMRRGGRYGY